MNPTSSPSPKKFSLAFLIIAFVILLGVSLVFLFMKDSLFPISSAGPRSSVDQKKAMEAVFSSKASTNLPIKQQTAIEQGISSKKTVVPAGQKSSMEAAFSKK